MNKWFLAVILTGLSGMIAFSADANTKQVIIKTVTNPEAYRIIQENKTNKNFVLLDVRTSEEFREKHIRGAVNIDFYGKDYTAKLRELDKSKRYLIYCRSGNRSGKTLPVMKELGFKEVYDMSGGINEWEANGYPLIR